MIARIATALFFTAFLAHAAKDPSLFDRHISITFEPEV